MSHALITSPDDPALAELCDELSSRAAALDLSGAWPAEQLRLCGEYGVYRWFADRAWGGQGWDQKGIVRGYVALARSCLTTTFIITQREAACRRIETSDNELLKSRVLPALTRGDKFTTVGISHLTTSRRHVARPILRATPTEGGYRLDGFSAWVTGAAHADYVVVGATVMDGDVATPQQILAAVPTELSGVRAELPAQLVSLSASHTGQFTLEGVELADEWLLAGPVDNVMSVGIGGGTGGLQTSTLALGLSKAAIDFLVAEADRRPDLMDPLDALAREYDRVETMLHQVVRGTPGCDNENLRFNANSLVLRATQSALAAAKGAGYVAGHPAGRWCREALFFLVWSCPQPVLAAQMCELAGILGEE